MSHTVNARAGHMGRVDQHGRGTVPDPAVQRVRLILNTSQDHSQVDFNLEHLYHGKDESLG